MTTFLVASFHNRPQLLHFEPESDGSPASLTLETLQSPEFQDYTWITRHPSIPGLFYALQRYPDKHGVLSILRLSVNEEGEQSSSSSLSTSSRRLEIVRSYPSHGNDPCHLGLSSPADRLAIANYDSSTVAVYALRTDDGMVDESIPPQVYDLAKEEETFEIGPNRERQEAPHPHGCFYNDQMDCFLVPDLGADKLRLIGGKEKGKSSSTIGCKRGAGPRHAAINSKANLVYVVNELDNTITVHGLITPTTTSGPIASYSILPSDVAASTASTMNGAAISLTPDKRFIYVTNRLESHPEGDAVVYFKVTDGGRALERIGETRTGLDHPRAAEISECEKTGGWYYIVGSRTQKGAVVYEVDKENGQLKEVARNMEVIMPSGFAVV